MQLTQASNGRRKRPRGTEQVLQEGRDVHPGRKHEKEAGTKVRSMPAMSCAFDNIPSSDLGCAEEVEKRKHDHKERMRSERGGIDEVRVQYGVPHVRLQMPVSDHSAVQLYIKEGPPGIPGHHEA